MTKLLSFSIAFLLALASIIGQEVKAQGVPELIYYKFDSPGTTVQNFASTPVGTNPAPLTGATIGGTGQFGTALVGNGATTASNSVNTGWAPNRGTGSWTISMWLNNIPSSTNLQYFFGDVNTSSLRAFTGGVAGAGGIRLVGGGITAMDIANVIGTNPVVIHYVYDATAGNIKAYINGVLNSTTTQTAVNLTGTGPFYVGGYPSNNGLPTGGLLDEFRFYNRALTQAEISTTWNVTLPYAVSPNDGGVTAFMGPGSPVAPGSQNIQVKIKNYGTSPLTSAQIGWKVGSTMGTPFAFTGNLAPNTESAPITIGSFNFPAGSHTIKAWTASPNGVTDGNHFNDTASISIIACNIVNGTFTINKNAAASATNFQSFGSALQAMTNCGINGPVTFNVVAGTGPYNEQVVIPSINGASATNTITFNGNGNTLVNPNATGDALKLDGAKYFRFNNLKVDAATTATSGAVVLLANAAQNNIFDGCTFTQNITSTSTLYGIQLTTGSSNNTFQNNTIIGSYYGVYNNGASGTTNNNNSFINNTLRDQYAYAFYSAYANGALFEGNDISRPNRTTVSTMYGFYLTTGNTGIIISKNRLHNTHDVATTTNGSVYGVYLISAGTIGSENIIKNNAFYNINNSGGLFYGFYNSGGNNTYYYHNTISADNPAVTYTTLRAMYFVSASTNVKFMNNNFSLTSPATTKHAIYLASTTIALTSNNNNLYVGASGNVGYYSGDKATLADWKAANSGAYDQNSVSADPQFVNVATGNLKPINSTLNNIGVAVTPAVADDITGAVRNTTTPDPGAYEFTPAPNDAGITTIISPVSPVIPNASQPVTVTLKNYGLNPLTAVNITWTVNGTAQTTYNWTGNLANNQTANVTIGNYSFPAGTFTLNICTSQPNGAADPNSGNDCQSMTVISCNPLAGTYTIDKNAGATATNFISFASAVNTLNSCGISAPVIFNVVAATGPYNETITIMPVSGASATNTITFNGNANVLSSPTASADAVIKLDGAKYVRFNNLKIEANSATTAGTVVSLINAATNNTFNGNTITHNTTTTTTSHAVYVYTGSSNNTFQNNTITGAYYGIYNYGSTTTANTGNQFIGNILKDMYYYGIYNYYSTGTLIEGNDISRPTRANAATLYAIYNSTGGTGITISKNRIHNTHDAATSLTGTVYGIYTSAAGTAGSENMIKNNALYNVNNTGGAFYALYNTGGNNTYYYYNTVAVDAATASYSTLRGMYFGSASTNVKFINNNISLASTATTKHAIYLASTTIALISNNNNLYAPGGNVGYYGSAMTTLADWKLANSGAYDQASVSADPVFASSATGNLRPTVVAVNDLGQPVTGITDDITGASRHGVTPDMGAFEFSVNPNDVGIIAISGPSSTGCGLSATETITVTIKNFGSATKTNIPVSYKINGGALVNDTYIGSIAANDTDTLNFTTKANLSNSGAYVIVAMTNLTGDSDASNNTDTLRVTNSLIPGLPMTFNFETPATGISRFRTVIKPKSNITEGAGASFGTASTKGIIMDGVDNTNWIPPVGVTDPWANNMDNFSAAYICISPAGGAASDSLWLTFDLKQLFKVANANTNFRVTVNGTQVGPTYRPPFAGTPINWQKVKVDLTAYKNDPTVMIGLESSVKEAYANGAGTANLVDNVVVQRRIVAISGVKNDVLAAQLSVFPNPSNGNFKVSLPQGKAYSLEVTDLAGKTIMKQTAKGDAQLKLENQAKGIYLLKVNSEGASTVRKIIVE